MQSNIIHVNNEICTNLSETKDTPIPAEKKRKDDLEKLFISQIKILENRGVPPQLIDYIRTVGTHVFISALEQPCHPWNIPFLPVIPLTLRSLYDLMAMVRLNQYIGRVGGPLAISSFDPELVTDIKETSKWVYYISDVEIGDATSGKSPKNARKFLKSRSRNPLTLAETIAVCVYTDVLSRYGLFAAGSEYESFEWVPEVRLYGGQPILDRAYIENPHREYATASCGKRIYY